MNARLPQILMQRARPRATQAALPHVAGRPQLVERCWTTPSAGGGRRRLFMTTFAARGRAPVAGFVMDQLFNHPPAATSTSPLFLNHPRPLQELTLEEPQGDVDDDG